MSFGLDYVSGPSVAAMKAANVAFVCRYVGYTDPALPQTKILTPEEAKANSQAGIDLVSNYEWYKNRALEGYNSGVVDAHRAAAEHAHCGGPADKPIYFSVDLDTDGALVADYFKGIASVLSLSRTAAYGSYRVLKYLFDNNLITWGWQTYAWSYGAWEPRAHIQQYSNGQTLAGHSVDYDRSIKSDYGQWRTHIMIDMHTPGVTNYFTLQADGSWLCQHPGFDGKQKIIAHGMLSFYQSFGNAALCGLTFLGLPVSNEIAIAGLAGVTRQHFERGVLFYDPQHQLDRPPGSGDVYLAHIYGGPGQDPRIVPLQSQVNTLNSQVDALTTQLASAPSASVIPPEVQAKLDHYAETLQSINLLSVALP